MRAFGMTTQLLIPLPFFAAVAFVANLVDAESPRNDRDRQLSSSSSERLFESEIRPLLIARCHACHAGEKAEGGLRLDSGDSVRRGGDTGPVLVPNDADASLIVSAIRHEELEMPPDQLLPQREQELFVRWINEGAKWPEQFETQSLPIGNPSVGDWWAADPLSDDLVDTELQSNRAIEPASATRIDDYVDRRLVEHEMQRAPAADRQALIRRLSFDLLGLPPSLAEIDDFVADKRPDAYRRLVDRMFSSPAYGERMARLWLDLVRYAESDGWRQDAYRPQAYFYRQWVVDAFNVGMPYDEFVAMQLAGDEISPGDPNGSVAVGFLRLGIFEFNQRDAEDQWRNIVDEMTDVTADVFLATGMACAKCHDHKFDPISRADYFRLRSVFAPILFVDEPGTREVASKDQIKVDRLLSELHEIEGDVVEQLAMSQLEKFTLPLQAIYAKPDSERNSYEQQLSYLMHRQTFEEGASGAKVKAKLGDKKSQRREQILKRLEKLGASPYPTPDVLTVRDASGVIRPTRIPGRDSGPEFSPGVPGVFGGQALAAEVPSHFPRSSGRRLALAEWITSPGNPITARVLANRLWQYHFGTGLVRSANDFGVLGSRPTHPRLLDHLAKRLHVSSWNIQAVQKEIVLSETYGQSSVHPAAGTYRQVDAANRLLWRHSVRRLDAEQYRDALLVATGALDHTYGGPSFPGTPPRRTLYLQRFRNTIDPMLQLLDAPPGLVSAAKRDETVTAPQALLMMNSPRVTQTAARFAERVRRDFPGADARHFVNHAHRLVTGVAPKEEIAGVLAELVSESGEGETDACHVLLNGNAFLFVE